MMIRQLLQLSLLAALLTISAYADDAPAWLRQAASAGTQSYEKNVPAVVLLDESRLTISDEGKIKRVNYYAVRLLTRAGNSAAIAREIYQTDAAKQPELKAWLLHPSGKVIKYDKNAAINVAAADNDVYNQVMVRKISARGDAEVGDVFGYEATTEETTVFTQFDWSFQEHYPVVLSRFTLTIPEKWTMNGIAFNHDPIMPIINGQTQTWELRNLPPIVPCPNSPPLTSIAPRLAVNLFPPANAKTYGPSFQNWEQVSAWTYQLTDAQAGLNDELATKAKELASSAKNDYDRIQAIARFAQSIRYISIQTGLSRGGGYRPHLASEVLAKNYGDCKDKANLMRALLKAIGVESYLVTIYSGDATYVRAEWPSPHQFNHCIIAVKVSDATAAEAVVQHATLGRLLIFDPTDEHTPFGTLPAHEQDSFALVIAASKGALLKMPMTAADTMLMERTVEATLTAEGLLTATLREKAVGAMAANAREEFKSLAEADYRKRIESFITRGVPRAKVTKIAPQDVAAEGKFNLEVELSAAEYAQNVQNKMLLFKPALLPYPEPIKFSEAKREQPILLETDSRSEITRINLPKGFEIDELPAAQIIKESFGQCELKYEVKDGTVIYSRTIRLQKATIPATQTEQVKTFFARIKTAEQNPVVLVRK